MIHSATQDIEQQRYPAPVIERFYLCNQFRKGTMQDPDFFARLETVQRRLENAAAAPCLQRLDDPRWHRPQHAALTANQPANAERSVDRAPVGLLTVKAYEYIAWEQGGQHRVELARVAPGLAVARQEKIKALPLEVQGGQGFLAWLRFGNIPALTFRTGHTALAVAYLNNAPSSYRLGKNTAVLLTPC